MSRSWREEHLSVPAQLTAAADELERTGGILSRATATRAVREFADQLLGRTVADAVRVLRAAAKEAR